MYTEANHTGRKWGYMENARENLDPRDTNKNYTMGCHNMKFSQNIITQSKLGKKVGHTKCSMHRSQNIRI
jgi:hypothetical protein